MNIDTQQIINSCYVVLYCIIILSYECWSCRLIKHTQHSYTRMLVTKCHLIQNIISFVCLGRLNWTCWSCFCHYLYTAPCMYYSVCYITSHYAWMNQTLFHYYIHLTLLNSALKGFETEFANSASIIIYTIF